MHPHFILDWLYSYKLVANNKKNARLLYKLVIEHENLYDLSLEEQKNKLRTVENREKASPLDMINDYERILTERYYIDFHFSLADLYHYHSLAHQIAKVLFLFHSHLSSHRNIPERVLNFKPIDGLSLKESLFLMLISDTPILSSKADGTESHFISDTILFYPQIASAVMRIESLKAQVSAFDMIGKTFVWSMVFLELQTLKFGNETAVSELSKLWDRTHISVLKMLEYADSLPLKMPRYCVSSPSKLYPTNSMMDIIYDFRLHFMQLVGLFQDRHFVNSFIYLCPISCTLKDNSNKAYFISENKELFVEFMRSTFGHYALVCSAKKTEAYYCELTATDNDDDNSKFIGTAVVRSGINLKQNNPFASCENIDILGFEYSYDGKTLTFLDDDDNVICALKRIDKDKSEFTLKADCTMCLNELVEEFGFATISRCADEFIFEFKGEKQTLRYKVSANIDSRLRHIRFDDIVYLYLSPEGEKYLVIEPLGYIKITDNQLVEECR